MGLQRCSLMLVLTLPALLSAQATMPEPAGLHASSGTSVQWGGASVAPTSFRVSAETSAAVAKDAEERWTWIAIGAGVGAAFGGAWAFREVTRPGAESFFPHLTVGIAVVGGGLIGGLIGGVAYEGYHDGKGDRVRPMGARDT